MDLHQSGNQNLYMRQSYITQSGLPRPNLESRIIYAQSNKSFKDLCKWLCLATALLLAVFLTIHWISPPAEFEVCKGEGRFSSLVSSLKARLTGQVDPHRCKLKKEVTSEELPAQTVTTVKEIRQCPIDSSADAEPREGWSIWNWFQRSSPNCDRLREHEHALAQIKPSIKPFSVYPPSLRDIQSFPSKYTQYRKYANETENPNLRSEVQFLFDEIDRDRNWASTIHNRDVTHQDFIRPLTDLDFLFNLQLKAKDLQESGRILAEKDATIDRLKTDFHGKTGDKNCTDQINDLRRLYQVNVDKKASMGSLIDSLKDQLREVQLKIEDTLKRRYSDTNGPLSKANQLEKEIVQLQSAKLRLSGKISDGDNPRISLDRDRLQSLESKIRSIRDEIGILDDNGPKVAEKILDAKRRLDAVVVALGALKYKLTMSLRSEEVKRFLTSLLKKEGGQKSIEQLFSDNQMSKKEIIKIVKAFLDQSKGYDSVEISWSDDEWAEAIEKDQKEFQEIMKVYQELKEMISKYREVEVDITAYRNGIAERERERNDLESEWRSLQAKALHDKERRKALEDEVVRLQLEIKGLQMRIAEEERVLANDKAELSGIERDLGLRLKEKEDLDRQNKALIDDYNKENQGLKSREKQLQESIEATLKNQRIAETDIARALYEIERLKDSCSLYIIFEYLLREFLRVS